MSTVKVNYPLPELEVHEVEVATCTPDSYDRRPCVSFQVSKDAAKKVKLDDNVIVQVTGTIESVGKHYDQYYEVQMRLDAVEFETENAFEKLAREEDAD